MPADALLSRLHKVKRKAEHQWIACCPAHQDKSPSMTIAELDDGRVLIHCFAGCDATAILAAVGLDFDALFPPKSIEHHVKPSSAPFIGRSVLEAVSFEALVVVAAANKLRSGDKLSEEDHARLVKAAERLQGVVTHVRT